MGKRAIKEFGSGSGAQPRGGEVDGGGDVQPVSTGSSFERRPLRGTDGDQAKRKLGKLLKPENSVLRPMPFDSSLSYAFRMVGGIETAIAGARLVRGDERFAKLLWAWENLGERERRGVKLEDLLAGCEIGAAEFLGFVVPEIYRRNVDMAQLVAAVNHPRIVEAAVVAAQMTDGFSDRKMLLESSGFLPKGQGVVINNNNAVDNRSVNLSGGHAGSGLPAFEARAMDLGKALQEPLEEQYQLPAPRASAVIDVPSSPVGVEIVQP